MERTRPIGFLDLPKEIRLMIYERIPVQIKQRPLDGRFPVKVREPVSAPAEWKETQAFRVMESVPLAILRVNRQIGEEAKDVMAKKKDYLLSRPIRVIILFRPEDSFHFSDDTYTQSTYPRLMQCLQEEVELEKFGEEYIYTKIIGNGNKVKCQKVQGPDSKLRREILVIYDKPYITFFNSMGKSLLEFYPNSNINIYPYPGAHFERGTKPTKAGLDPVASLWVNNTTYAVFQECCFPVVNIYLRNHRNTDTANRLNSAISIATDVNGRDPRGEVDPEWLKEWQDGETLVGLV